VHSGIQICSTEPPESVGAARAQTSTMLSGIRSKTMQQKIGTCKTQLVVACLYLAAYTFVPQPDTKIEFIFHETAFTGSLQKLKSTREDNSAWSHYTMSPKNHMHMLHYLRKLKHFNLSQITWCSSKNGGH